MRKLISVLRDVLFEDNRRRLTKSTAVLTEEYDYSSGEWTTFVESVSDACSDAGFLNDTAQDRHALGDDSSTLMSSEVRFDIGDWHPNEIKQVFNDVLSDRGMDPRHPTSDEMGGLRVYGRDVQLAKFAPDASEVVVIVYDDLADKQLPYVALYLLSDVRGAMTEADAPTATPSEGGYTAIVVNDKKDLERLFSTKYPDLEGWTIRCEHMTIALTRLSVTTQLKKLPEDQVTSIRTTLKPGTPATLMITEIGRTPESAGQAIAVKVTIQEQEIAQAVEQVRAALKFKAPLHITLATGPEGKPSQSKSIISWEPIDGGIKVAGTVQELKSGG